MKAYDPPSWDVVTTCLLGATLLRPFWGGWLRRLGLRGGESVLDFGSGSGQLSLRLAMAVGPSGRLTCLDISPRWLELARRELSGVPWAECRLGVPQDLPRGTFDLVHVHYVLHAIPAGRRGATVEQLAERLRPGGRLALREPLYYRSLHLGELRELCARAGLQAARGPERHWWLAGPVVELVLVRPPVNPG